MLVHPALTEIKSLRRDRTEYHPRVRWCVAVLLASGVAQAEPETAPLPIAVVVTAGIGTAASDTPYGDANYEPITAVQLDVGARFRGLMLGAHVGFHSGTPRTESRRMSMFDESFLYTYRPMQIGLTGHIVVHDRFYATPWLGVQRGWLRQECSTFTDHDPEMPPVTNCTRLEWDFLGGSDSAFGLGIGADAVEVNGHRVTVTAAFSLAQDGNLMYTSVWLGVGYRFWDR